MLCIFQNQFDIYYNLAAEEYLLRYKDEDILMVWRSNPSVVVGKHQNAFAEINQRFVGEQNISVARRLSGGGAVYHDHGNLNFTFILKGIPGKLVDFKRFVGPVIDYLQSLGIRAIIGEKNDILFNSLKISGNAEHIYKNRVLHHGTLLYNADLDTLRQALKVIPGRYIDKAVQSNRASVTNIQNYLNNGWDINVFAIEFFRFLKSKYANTEEYVLTTNDENEILKLYNDKYTDWNWIYGYSPSCRLLGELNIMKTKIEVELQLEKGIVKRINSASLFSLELKEFFQSIESSKFDYKLLISKIEELECSSDIKDQLKNLFF
jgi:lipoate---protein ligase